MIMTNYMVFVASIMDSSYSTLEEAEKRVAEIVNKYDFLDPDTVHITVIQWCENNKSHNHIDIGGVLMDSIVAILFVGFVVAPIIINALK